MKTTIHTWHPNWKLKDALTSMSADTTVCAKLCSEITISGVRAVVVTTTGSASVFTAATSTASGSFTASGSGTTTKSAAAAAGSIDE